MDTRTRAQKWYDLFNRLAHDLYAYESQERYTLSFCQELAEQASDVLALAQEKETCIVAHNYQYPELQEVAETVGDSLGLSQYIAERQAKRVDFCGVRFMGETAKIIGGEKTRVFMPDQPGCSLVASIDHTVIDQWKEEYPEGVVISYINTDVHTKAKSDYICTSRNAGNILRHVIHHHPKKRILFLPDKFLGTVILHQLGIDMGEVALEETPHLVRLQATYQEAPLAVDLYKGFCHVHAKIGEKAIFEALEAHPEAELLIHPECGCASSCLLYTMEGDSRFQRSYYLSTEGMVRHAQKSSAQEFIVATESGMVYRLRKEVPDKIFYPVSYASVCEYMKMNTLEKLLLALREDRNEILIDPEIARQAMGGIHKMLAIA